MLYRNIRKKSSGEWVDVLLTVAEGGFSVPESSHRESVAEALGALPGELETVEGTKDKKSGALISLPVAGPSPEKLIREGFVALSNADPDLLTDSQIKELLSFVSKKVLGP